MKKIIPMSLFVVSVIFFSQISCKKAVTDPAFCANAWATELSDEITAFTNAATVYANDPTTANCNLYKAAFQSYLNGLKPFLDCSVYTAAQKTELENAIAEVEAELPTLCD